MLKRIAGVILMVFGVGFGAWVIYAAFVLDDPEHKIRRPGKAIGLAVAAIIGGFYLVKGSETAAATDEAEGPQES